MYIDPSIAHASTQLANQAVSYAAQSDINKRTREWNEKMYNRQRMDSLADWHMQAEYNSPAAQMARLKAAGLNPNLVYGKGADATVSHQVKPADIKPWNPRAPEFDLGSPLAAYFDTQMKQAQISNMEKNATILEREADLKDAQTLAVLMNTKRAGVGYERDKIALERDDKLLQTSIDMAAANLMGRQKQNALLDTQNAKMQVEIGNMIEANARNWMLADASIGKMIADTAVAFAQKNKIQVEEKAIRARIPGIIAESKISQHKYKIWQSGANPNDPAAKRLIIQGVEDVLTQLGEAKEGLDKLPPSAKRQLIMRFMLPGLK